MKRPSYTAPLLALLFSLFSQSLFAQMAPNNTCATAVDFGTLTGLTVRDSSHLYQADATNLAAPSCGLNRADVWYKFTTPAGARGAVIQVTRTSNPSTLTNANTLIEFFNSTTCPVSGTTTGACSDISSTRNYVVAPSTTYYFRIYTTAANVTINPGQWNFMVSVAVATDDCATALTLQPAVPSQTGTLFGATTSTATPAIPAGCTGTPDDDVWFKFVAGATNATVSLSGPLAASNGYRFQVFSGTCTGGLTSMFCGNNLLNLSGLTAGDTYFVRVYSNAAGAPTSTTAHFEISVSPLRPGNVGSGRMNEVFQQTILSPPNLLADPWEIIYGPDDNLWITEAKGYKVYKMNPTTGVKTTVLDVSNGSTFFAAPDNSFHATFSLATHNPQGGLAGMVLHPKFLATTGAQNYAYVSYVYSYDSASVLNGGCKFFKNRLVRFTYNPGTDKFESPVSLCDTLPGGNDHNSQRIFIAPVDGIDYLFYASGDMGGGQLACAARVQKAQMMNSYEGKILRFNLIADLDPAPSLLNKWIPNDNPFNGTLGEQSAVWVTGIRNNQGFAYDTATKILYGSSHGAYSDDEINIIEKGKNYGHPLVQGYASDNNYNGASAGTPKNSPPSANPIITNEAANAAAIGSSYKDPLFSAYASSPDFPSIYNDIWNATPSPNNAKWPSEGWAGLDLYSNNVIPGWKGSLVATSLKWGRLVRIKLGASGTITVPSNHPINNAGDTISYFGSQNRFRDLAFAPNGKDIYVIMDRSTSTSGPSALYPVVPTCQGCVQKYTFLGYSHNAGTGKSNLPTTIPVDLGTAGACAEGSKININASNNNIWVPITGPEGNIVAEIKANNQNLGDVTTSFYAKTGTVREDGGRRLFLNRNITITPQFQPGAAVSIRLYITKAELDSLKSAKNSAGAGSGVAGINNLSIYKNSDACGAPFTTVPTKITPLYADVHGDSGYVLGASITAFSSFYFANSSFTILPMELIVFKGALQGGTAQLQWKTENETSTASFQVERSIDGRTFEGIGSVTAKGNPSNLYQFADQQAGNQPSALVYYRLKIVDAAGSSSYSQTISFTLNAVNTFNIYPNPVKDVLKVEVSLQQKDDVQIRITDMQGRAVFSQDRFLESGLQLLDIDVKGWAPQTYTVKITSLKNKLSTLKHVIKL